MLMIDHHDEIIEVENKLPVLPLRDIVIFPNMIVPLLVGRSFSMNAIEAAINKDRYIFTVMQKDVDTEDINSKDLHRVGTISRILQILRLPDATIRVTVEALTKAKVTRYVNSKGMISAKIEPIEMDDMDENIENEALIRKLKTLFEQYVDLNESIPNDILIAINNIPHHDHLVDFISARIGDDPQLHQKLLEIGSVSKQAKQVLKILLQEIEILNVEKEIETEVRSQLNKNQKEFYLAEQLKAINRKLGVDDEETAFIQELAEKIDQAKMPEVVEAKAQEELNRLKRISFMSQEAGVIENYLEWLIQLPWEKQSDTDIALPKAQAVLDEDHYGLKKVKERILEYLSVLKLSQKVKGPVLCLVGPPGVGKTSLGRSIARAMQREFVRISLGGVRDEAEIRGHRRTYVGAMPGRVIQGMKKAGVKNPVFLLDEVDKMSTDFRGDPSAALLEVLDQQQNKHFSDHFIEVDYDLSEVIFITTANSLHTIPEPLKDRFEIIRLPGYLDFEKLNIAQNYLLPRQLEENGLQSAGIQVELEEASYFKVIHEYTRESGVRQLERELATICRKIAREVNEKPEVRQFQLNGDDIERFLGVPKFSRSTALHQGEIGVVNGLAWTSVGGEVLPVEVLVLDGTGKLELTGSMGTVMQESARAAMGYLRSKTKELQLPKDFYKKHDIHIHLPEGAVPKDGPSAGITMAIAIASALIKEAVIPSLCMTGEISLRGNVLPIGGLNEKLIAAKRFNLCEVIIPKENEKDLQDIAPEVKEGLHIHPVEHMDEVCAIAFPDKKKC